MEFYRSVQHAISASYAQWDHEGLRIHFELSSKDPFTYQSLMFLACYMSGILIGALLYHAILISRCRHGPHCFHCLLYRPTLEIAAAFTKEFTQHMRTTHSTQAEGSDGYEPTDYATVEPAPPTGTVDMAITEDIVEATEDTDEGAPSTPPGTQLSSDGRF
ncbi:hypothetical protein PG990_006744 [Apiospora arundinis]|uniref:Uncharacterized protein n=1 Tax=Apiospora arundinis TaxID=335852 RepID=A0ABR2JBR5_9PEZI